MLSLSANAPTLFPTVTALPASVCAEVSAAARSRVDVGDLDELVRARCKLREQQGHLKLLFQNHLQSEGIQL